MTPWIFAGLAVAYVVWSGRRASPASLPPLVPTGIKPLAPPVATPAAPPGSGWALFLGIAVWSAFLLWIATTINTPGNPTPAPGPTPVAGLDLRGKFVGEHAAEDAAITSELLAALADKIQFDGTLPEPRLRSGQQLAELRSTAREYRTEGVKLGDRQPLARDAIAAYLEESVGTDGGPIDAAARRKWIDAFRSVSRAAAAALGR